MTMARVTTQTKDAHKMIMHETDVIELPACWASALINGDYSGLDEEAARCMTKVAELAREGFSVVDCADEARFTNYQLYDTEAERTGGDVLEYTILR